MKRKGPLFNNPKLQKAFNKNGYVILDLLDSYQVDQLQEVYEKFRGQHEKITIPFVSTSHTNDKELIQTVDNAILQIVESSIKRHLPHSQILFSNFLIKKSGNDSTSNPHQDVTFVDEKKYISFSIWIPLTDVDSTNGCMRVLKGSHLFFANIRTHSPKKWKFDLVSEYIERDMIDCPMKKGQALVFSHALIHGSYPNRNPNSRIAAVVACYPDGADLFHYQEVTGLNKLAKYRMNKEAYVSYIKGSPPALGKFVEEMNEDVELHSPLTYYIQKQVAKWKQLLQIR